MQLSCYRIAQSCYNSWHITGESRDGAQRALLERMGLTIPERLARRLWVRKPKNLTEM